MSLLGGSRCISIPPPVGPAAPAPFSGGLGTVSLRMSCRRQHAAGALPAQMARPGGGATRPTVADQFRLHGDRCGTGVLARGPPMTPQIDVLYVKDLGHLL